MLKVLIVDDDFMIADCLEDVLADAGYEVCGIAEDLGQAVALSEEHHPTCRSLISGCQMGRLART